MQRERMEPGGWSSTKLSHRSWSAGQVPLSQLHSVTRGFLKPLVPTECQHSECSSPSLCWPVPLACSLIYTSTFLPSSVFLPSPALRLSACFFSSACKMVQRDVMFFSLIAAARAKIDTEIKRLHCLFNFWLFFCGGVAVAANPIYFHAEVNQETFAGWLRVRQRYQPLPHRM